MQTGLLAKPVGGDLAAEPLEDRDVAIEKLQDELAKEAASIVSATLAAPEMKRAADGSWVIPDKWFETYGPDGAERRAAVAAASWMNAKEAPVFIKVASSILVGMIRASADRESGNRTLNVALVQMEVSPATYPTLEVTDEK